MQFSSIFDHCSSRFKGIKLDLNTLAAQMGKSNDSRLSKIYLSQKEQQIFSLFTADKRRLEWLGGRICAKQAVISLGQTIKHSLSWQDILILADQHGKPFVEFKPASNNGRVPLISISHSHGWAVAMAAYMPCGIDIQRNNPSLLKVQRRFSNACERKILAQTFPTASRDTTTLALLWSAKEAVRKMATIHPLLNFTEIELKTIDSPIKQEKYFYFTCHRPHNLDYLPEIIPVITRLCDNFAMALTVAQYQIS